jgi:hypothetical protein
MTLKQFNELSDFEKTEIILKGSFLADRQTDDYHIRLYYISTFFVEVFFHNATRLITHFRAFDDVDLALPYVEDLNVMA